MSTRQSIAVNIKTNSGSAWKGRRTDYDVTDRINMEDPDAVNAEVKRIFQNRYPPAGYNTVEQAFRDVIRLFRGEFPGHHGCDTYYHDLRHTLETVLAMARMIDGFDTSHPYKEQLGSEMAVLGLISGLLHDTGYIRSRYDYRNSSGACYTTSHIRRSQRFIKRYLPILGLTSQVEAACRLVSLTGLEVKIEKVRFADKKERIMGYILGTADYLGQMSDRIYLEKCRDYLYPEFVAGGVTEEICRDGTKNVIYASAEDLLCKTPDFYKYTVKPRLEQDFEAVFEYAAVHFNGRNLYIEEVEENIAYLRKVIYAQDFSLLKRCLPKSGNLDQLGL